MVRTYGFGMTDTQHLSHTLQVVEDHILRYHAASSDVRREDRLAAVMLRSEVIDLLQAARPLLQPIFAFYVSQQE